MSTQETQNTQQSVETNDANTQGRTQLPSGSVNTRRKTIYDLGGKEANKNQ